MHGIDEVIMMMAFSMYPQRINSIPPAEPRFVMLGKVSSLVVLMMDATIALKGQYICEETEARKTNTMPRLRRPIKLILIRNFKLRFQKTTVGNTAKNKSAAELKAMTDYIRNV